jgi:hypothetical protein
MGNVKDQILQPVISSGIVLSPKRQMPSAPSTDTTVDDSGERDFDRLTYDADDLDVEVDFDRLTDDADDSGGDFNHEFRDLAENTPPMEEVDVGRLADDADLDEDVDFDRLADDADLYEEVDVGRLADDADLYEEVDVGRLADDADLYEEVNAGDDAHFVDLRETKLRSTQLENLVETSGEWG